ncbi:ammonium transporter [Hyphobacterium marinum]|uniref:Ammonium transporter n=1 Tax=Hyphobacterium marinum TaxID=3116574 RepID=A0ABU7LVS4_9PROT|nr:ammonium transporter [Hyphobacterium sp. Y6023]MEE2565664.1 ammonium transporter [Hyphobacterium sp. Y6023]
MSAPLTDPQTALESAAAASAFVDNSFLLLFSGMVVVFMAAGFCMLESGLVRAKNAATIALKNISLFAIAGIAFYLVGYRLMYDGVDGGWIGTFGVWSPDALDEPSGSVASAADWFFQMAFVATAASIVSGTLAERITLRPFLIFVVLLTAFIYPIAGAWKWGEGWLHVLGFQDFAGSTLVHSVGGWAALTGAIILGPRVGKYGPDGRIIKPLPGSNLPLAALGTFILWFGWFGFNGGSQLAAGTIEDISAVGRIMANTNIAAAGGVVAALIASEIVFRKADLTFVLNGAIGGLVAITAGPLAPEMWQALLIGGAAGVIVVITVPLLDRLRIDDVVGAIPSHLLCGIFGTLIVPLTMTADGLSRFEQAGVQLLGVAAIGLFVAGTSTVIWLGLNAVLGLRPPVEEEMRGLDRSELGMQAYPDFYARQ